MNRSKSTVIKNCVTGIDNRIKQVFNHDVFGLYEGIVEKIDTENGLLNVRVPDLDNTVYEECRMMTICNTPTSAILPPVTINTHVIIAFQAFSLAKPVVLGQINLASNITTPFEEGTLVFRNGDCTLKLTMDSIILDNKKITLRITPNEFKISYNDNLFDISDSGITINSAKDITINAANKITLTGDAITANGEDITKDDIGWI